MPSRFDWQAEDDSQWGELEPEKGSSPRNRLRSLRLVIIVLVLMAVAAGGAVSFARVERFLNESSADTVQVVLGVHNLVLISAAEGDSELFSGLILDRLHEWTDAQVQLAERGLLLDRRPLNLFLSPGTTGSFIRS